MGFRSYVRALLPWCFPIQEVSLEVTACFHLQQQQQQEKKWLKSSFSMGFKSYVRQCLGTILMLLRPSLPLCFPIREVSFETKVCFGSPHIGEMRTTTATSTFY